MSKKSNKVTKRDSSRRLKSLLTGSMKLKPTCNTRKTNIKSRLGIMDWANVVTTSENN